MQTGQPKIVLPCRGDRRYALADYDEMIFSMPYEFLEELIEGLRFHVIKKGRNIPFNSALIFEYKLREAYKTIGNMIGMNLP